MEETIRAIEALRGEIAVLNERSVHHEKRMDSLHERVTLLCKKTGNKLIAPTLISSSVGAIAAIVVAILRLS